MNNPKNGFSTFIWGPPTWTLLHMISFNFPLTPSLEEKLKYKIFFLSIGNVLPCKICRKNFKKNLKQANFNNSVFKNRETFSRFVYNFHNSVNKMLGKPKYKSYAGVKKMYEVFRAGECAPAPRQKEGGCTLDKLSLRCLISFIPKEEKCIQYQIK